LRHAPGLEGDEATPLLFRCAEELNAAIVTHSHLDHAGSLPVLRRRHPSYTGFSHAADRAHE